MEHSLGRRNSVGKDGEDERHGFLGARVVSGLKLGLGYHGAGRGGRGRAYRAWRRLTRAGPFLQVSREPRECFEPRNAESHFHFKKLI